MSPSCRKMFYRTTDGLDSVTSERKFFRRDRVVHRKHFSNNETTRCCDMIRVTILFVGFLLLWCLLFLRVDRRDARHDRDGESLASERNRRRRDVLSRANVPSANSRVSRVNVRPADCSTESRYCVDNADCRTLCRSYKSLLFLCDDRRSTCEPRLVAASEKPQPPSERPPNEDGGSARECDAKLGEYAMLVGYTSLGTALWQCVQLYRHYRDLTSMCEGGRFEMNAKLREPSYRDCECPDGTVRAIHRSVDGVDSAYARSGALPHCVPERSWPLFRLSMRAVPRQPSDAASTTTTEGRSPSSALS